jgi:hypothetical protein
MPSHNLVASTIIFIIYIVIFVLSLINLSIIGMAFSTEKCNKIHDDVMNGLVLGGSTLFSFIALIGTIVYYLYTFRPVISSEFGSIAGDTAENSWLNIGILLTLSIIIIAISCCLIYFIENLKKNSDCVKQLSGSNDTSLLDTSVSINSIVLVVSVAFMFFYVYVLGHKSCSS